MKTLHEYVINAFNEMCSNLEDNKGEFGKMFALPNEQLSIDYINENTNLRLVSRKQVDKILTHDTEIGWNSQNQTPIEIFFSNCRSVQNRL